MTNQIDQALAFAFLEMNRAHQMRHFDAGARQLTPGAKISAFVGAGSIFQLDCLFQSQIVKLGNFVDQLQRLPGFALNFFRREIFVVEVNNFFYRARSVAQFIGYGDECFQHDR